MFAPRSSVLNRPVVASLPQRVRTLSTLVRARTGQRPAATYRDAMHSPLEITEAVAGQALAETWGWN